METNKISFGFSKVIKRPNLLQNKKLEEENKVELIKCLEGQEIKLVVEKPLKEALVIPLKENQKTSAALASLIRRRAVLLGEDELEPEPETSAVTTTNTITDANNRKAENLENRAARELLSEVTNAGNEFVEVDKLVLPVVKPDDLPLDGAKESSLDDYEAIPVQQFGTAMLRGMGWVEPPKKKGAPVDDLATMLRPKGMGLGADKALKPKPLLVQPEKNEILEIKRQAYVRILAGKHKDLYGQIEGFDDHAGRVIVKMAIGGQMEVFNEFMCQPVSKKEFSEYGKCINTAKYDKYKKMENEFGQIIVKKENEKQLIKEETKSKTDYKNEKHENSYKNIDIKKERFKRDPDTKHNDQESERHKIKEEVYENENNRVSYKNISTEPGCSYRHHDYNPHNSRSKNSSNKEAVDSHKNRRHRSRSPEYVKSKSTSSRNRKQSSDKELSDSSDSSDSDSSYERKHKKSSKKKSKRKSKKSKSKVRDYDTSSDMSEADRHKKRNHKKTKKSKKDRVRSRERR